MVPKTGLSIRDTVYSLFLRLLVRYLANVKYADYVTLLLPKGVQYSVSPVETSQCC